MAVEDGQRGGLLRRHEGGGGGGDGVAGGSVAGARATRESPARAVTARVGAGGGTSSSPAAVLNDEEGVGVGVGGCPLRRSAGRPCEWSLVRSVRAARLS